MQRIFTPGGVCRAMGTKALRLTAATALAAQFAVAVAGAASAALPTLEEQASNTWVKRSPLPDGPPSPRLGYEASWDYDPVQRRMIRWGAHDPGGGGPQLSETWTFDPVTCRWELLRTNNNPPGNCCCRENVQCSRDNRFYRFSYPAFGHGWFWDRSRYLREDSVWSFDLASRSWRNLRPGREPALNVGKPAFWDPLREVIWVYDTKLRVYDPFANTWTLANPSPQIGKRTYAAMDIDPEAGRLVLFGDHYQSDPRTWVYDIASGTWNDMQPAVAPPGIRGCPTMVFDSRNRKFICLTLADRWDGTNSTLKRMETWVYDLPANTWTRMRPPLEPDYSGTRGRLMRYLPDLNIVLLESRTDKEQQIWSYRLAEPPVPTTARPDAPDDVQLKTLDGGRVRLSWRPKAPGGVPAGVRVYRGTGAAPWQVVWEKLADVAAPATEYIDTGLDASAVRYYRVATLPAKGAESEPSRTLRTQPAVGPDARVDVLAAGRVRLTWKPLPGEDIVGYIVERAPLRAVSAAQKIKTARQYAAGIPLTFMTEKVALGAFERLTPKPLATNAFEDTIDLARPAVITQTIWRAAIKGGEPEADPKSYDMTQPGCPYAIYAWRVRAVNRLGAVGGPGPFQMSVANEVENFVGREEGDAMRLRWDASPHAGIRGYLVYRLNARGAGPGELVRLTPEPIVATEYTDPAIGGKARRYYVVVVDALGQEGLPTHPVWALRPWKAHYAPWDAADGWHQ